MATRGNTPKKERISGQLKRQRARGRAYLRAHPEAFGGGIDPKTGIRFEDGKRVSVTSPSETARTGQEIVLVRQQASKIQAQQQVPTPQQQAGLQQRQRNQSFINRFGASPQPPTPPPRPNIIEETKVRARVVRQGVGEAKVGVAKAGIGIAETSVNLFSLFGVQTITPGQDQKKFKFGGELGRIRDQPSTTLTTAGQVAVFAPLVISGTAGFIGTARAEGVRLAAKETILAFSPLKIRTGSFGALESQRQIQRLKFDVISTKQTKGDLTFRKTIGQAKDDKSVKLISSQISRGFGSKEVGRATTDIIAPRVTLRAGQVTPGFRAIRTETAFAGAKGSGARLSSLGGKSNLIGFQTTGTISQSKTILNVIGDAKGNQVIFSPFGKTTPGTTGTLLQKQPSYSQFISGKGNKFLKVGRQSFTEQIRFSDLNVRGLEFDLKTPARTFTPSPSSNLPASKLALKQLTSPAVISTPKAVLFPKTSSPVSVIASLGIKRSPVVVAQPQSTQLFKQKQTPITTTAPTQAIVPTTSVKTLSAVVQQPRQRSGQRQTPATQQIPAQVQVPKQTQIPAQIQIPKQIQLPRQVQRQVPFAPIRPTPPIRPQPTQSRVPLSFLLPSVSRTSRTPIQIFSVLGRRFGKFKVIGTARTEREAIFKGRQFASKTLGATFKVPGAKAVDIPGFTTKKKKGEVLFIENPRRRLKRGTKEIPEIQFFRQFRGGKKSGKKRKRQ